MSRYRLFQTIFGVIVFFLIGYFLNQYGPRMLPEQVIPERKLVFKDATVRVDVADSESLRVQGLSGRKNLAENTGLLFIFEKPSRTGFWMKDMNFPIDIIWFDQSWEVVSIKKNATPESFPEIFYPTTESLYVLEVSAGFVSSHNIEEGDFASFSKK